MWLRANGHCLIEEDELQKLLLFLIFSLMIVFVMANEVRESENLTLIDWTTFSTVAEICHWANWGFLSLICGKWVARSHSS